MPVEAKTKCPPGYAILPVAEAAMEQAEDIWALAFGTYWPRNYARFELTHVRGAFRGDDLHAVAAMVDMDMHFGEHWAPCGAIAAVATAPGQRYQNLVNSLLRQLVQELHDRQVPFSALYPFSYPFYERMGWAITHWMQEIEVSTEALGQIAGKRGKARNWRMLPLDRCEQTLAVHDRYCAQYNLSLRRGAARCRQLTFIPGRHWQYFIHDDGYMLWDLDASKDKRLSVLEFVYTSEEAYFDGLALLAQMYSQYEAVVWFDLDHEKLLRVSVPEPRPQIKLVPRMMSRVVDVQAFEKLLPRSLNGLKIYDPLGVSAPVQGDISVGEVLQLVTGVFNRVDERFPAHLHGIVSEQPNLCLERF